MENSPQPPITGSEANNPYPTTFVQVDTSSFKQVVQMLTGSTHQRNPIPPVKTGLKKEKPTSSSKLYERRINLKNFKLISPLGPSGSKPGFSPETLSPCTILDFPTLTLLSPVTPLVPDPFNRAQLDMDAEVKAIKEKGFYLHPSPANTPRDSEPRLLQLFPVTSPRVVRSSAANC